MNWIVYSSNGALFIYGDVCFHFILFFKVMAGPVLGDENIQLLTKQHLSLTQESQIKAAPYKVVT